MDYVALGQTIQHYRKQMKLTQGELAGLAGISMPFMGHIERGTRVASLETLVDLCRALKVTPNDLLAAEGVSAPQGLPEQMTIAPAQLLQSFVKALQAAAVDADGE